MKELMRKAHQMTREIVEKYNDVDYKTQFSLCLQVVIEDSKKEGVKMVELTGTEKQIKWANDIREEIKKSMSIASKSLERHLEVQDAYCMFSKVEEVEKQYEEIFGMINDFIFNISDAGILIESFKLVTYKRNYSEKIDAILDGLFKLEFFRKNWKRSQCSKISGVMVVAKDIIYNAVDCYAEANNIDKKAKAGMIEDYKELLNVLNSYTVAEAKTAISNRRK